MIENYAFDNLCSQIVDDLGKIIELIKDMKFKSRRIYVRKDG